MPRYRVPKPKPGVLEMKYGVAERGDNPDVIYIYDGRNCPRCDAHLLHSVISSKAYDWREKKFGPSLLDELTARGYDITTLKFSIKKKELKDE